MEQKFRLATKKRNEFDKTFTEIEGMLVSDLNKWVKDQLQHDQVVRVVYRGKHRQDAEQLVNNLNEKFAQFLSEQKASIQEAVTDPYEGLDEILGDLQGSVKYETEKGPVDVSTPLSVGSVGVKSSSEEKKQKQETVVSRQQAQKPNAAKSGIADQLLGLIGITSLDAVAKKTKEEEAPKTEQTVTKDKVFGEITPQVVESVLREKGINPTGLTPENKVAVYKEIVTKKAASDSVKEVKEEKAATKPVPSTTHQKGGMPVSNRRSAGQVAQVVVNKPAQQKFQFRVQVHTVGRSQAQSTPAMPSYLRSKLLIEQAKLNEQKRLDKFSAPQFGIEEVKLLEEVFENGTKKYRVEALFKWGSFSLPVRIADGKHFRYIKVTNVTWRKSKRGNSYPVLGTWTRNGVRGTAKCRCGHEFTMYSGTWKCSKCGQSVSVSLNFQVEGGVTFTPSEWAFVDYSKVVRVGAEVINYMLAFAHYGLGLDMFGLLDRDGDDDPTPPNGGGGQKPSQAEDTPAESASVSDNGVASDPVVVTSPLGTKQPKEVYKILVAASEGFDLGTIKTHIDRVAVQAKQILTPTFYLLTNTGMDGELYEMFFRSSYVCEVEKNPKVHGVLLFVKGQDEKLLSLKAKAEKVGLDLEVVRC